MPDRDASPLKRITLAYCFYSSHVYTLINNKLKMMKVLPAER